MKRTVYRDSKGGRFVSKATWNRSKAQGGTRYKRERIKVKKKEREITPPPPPPEDIFETWVITFEY